MDITGTYTFNAPPEKVWAMMMDPVAIASCIPGCEKLEPDGVDRYKAAITIGMAAITGRYEGTVAISDKVAPASYRLAVEGQGRPGFVKGSVAITLRGHVNEGRANTIVDVKGTAHTGGTIARLGQRLIGSAAKMMQDRFFACMQSKM
ncbi:MAG TPA: carbon monoxide dehydrogenase subunit G [Vicinamibacterales bacterium]|nr:carbon monoxide dehydrogenase subunit G [Vicinamibacterales bacterium]